MVLKPYGGDMVVILSDLCASSDIRDKTNVQSLVKAQLARYEKTVCIQLQIYLVLIVSLSIDAA